MFICETLIGCFAEPNCRLSFVLWNTLTVAIQSSEFDLCLSQALIGCFAEPDGGLSVVLRYA